MNIFANVIYFTNSVHIIFELDNSIHYIIKGYYTKLELLILILYVIYLSDKDNTLRCRYRKLINKI